MSGQGYGGEGKPTPRTKELRIFIILTKKLTGLGLITLTL